MSEEPIEILLIEDNPGDARLIREMLAEAKDATFHLECAKRLKTGLARLAKGGIHVVLLDLGLPDSQGLDTFFRTKTEAPGVPIVVLTVLEDEMVGVKAVQAGAQDYLVKGQVETRLLARSIRYALERKRAEEALRESEENFRTLAESAIDGILIAAGEGDTVYVNKQAAEITGYSVLELLKTTIKDLAHPDEFKKIMERYRRRLEGKSVPSRYEAVIIRKDGKSVPIELAATKTLWHGEAADLVFFRDITERKRAEEALRESEGKYRSLYETITDGIAGGPMDGRIVECNQAYADMLGYSKEELKDLTYQQLTPKRWHQMEAKIVEEQILKRGYSDEYEKEYIRKDGTVFPISAKVWLVRDEDGKPRGMWGIVRDITERKRLEERITVVSGRARRRIGQDLHDGLGQRLTGIAFMSKVLEQELAGKSLAEAVDAQEIVKLVNQAISETRRLARGLAPVDLNAEGLMLALQEFAANVEKLYGISCDFKCEEPVLIKDHFAALNLYRIAEEAVDNAIKHGKAKRVLIGLSEANDRTTLTVKDDGVGLPEEWEKSKGMGLRIINYRTRQIGASFDIRRDDGGGTIVTCSFPNISLKK